MTVAANKRYQSTSVRMPRDIYDQAKTALRRSHGASFNEFVVQAVAEKVRRLTEAEIDSEFAQMAHDKDFQRDAIALTSDFEKSDWEAFASGASYEQPKTKTRPSKARSR